MLSSCGSCCCFYCGDCFNFHRSEMLTPTKGWESSNEGTPRPIRMKDLVSVDRRPGYGTTIFNKKTFPASFGHMGGSFQFENPVCGEDVGQEIIYQDISKDKDLLNVPSQVSSSQQSASSSLYQKWNNKKSNVHWSLRKQPLFDHLSGNLEGTSSLVTPTTDESYDSSEDSYSESRLGYPDYDNIVTHIRDSSTSPENFHFGQQLKDEMADVTAEMETLDGGEDSKNNPKNKQMSIGRKKFNMDPKKGLEYLIEHGLLKNTPEDISKFLYNGEGLSKTAIGDYLGERHEFNQTVLDAFVALHDFTDLILVQALRQFLWSFRLPGEAQKIDRMMEKFAHHYCSLNPSIFQHPDTCFVLSFAIIMLNTSLHNPAVRDKDKQNLEQFIKMNRSIDNGQDLPRELLESLYESIKTEPFKIPEDDGNDLMHTFFNPDREGWLWKQGGRYKSWKRRWFILNDNCLYYFEYTTDKEPRGIIPLENIEVREVHDRNKPHCFELYATSTDFIKACKTDSEGKVVEGKHTVYRMSASTHEEKEDWIKCIRQSISHNPFYDLLAKRKKNIQKSSS